MDETGHMEARRTALEELVSCPASLDSAVAQLRCFPWDSPQELVSLKLADVAHVLDRLCLGSLRPDQVEAWADALECREDVAFESDAVVDLVFRLANPEINEPITAELAIALLSIHSGRD